MFLKLKSKARYNNIKLIILQFPEVISLLKRKISRNTVLEIALIKYKTKP